MAIVKTYGSARRRNVAPTSSVLRTVVRDFNCSGTDFLVPPEDGQFVVCTGIDATNPVDETFFGSDSDPSATDAQAAGLHMVWSSPLQSDRSALGEKRVPVLWLGSIEVDLKLYNAQEGTLSSSYQVGQLVSVAPNQSAVATGPTGQPDIGTAADDAGGALNASGSKRLVLTAMGTNDKGWAVGYVTAVSDGAAAKDKTVSVFLYDQPRKIGSW